MKKTLLLGSILLSFNVFATDLASGPSGGMGGSAFTDQPPSGSKLTGVTICSGSKVDSIQAIYTAYGQTIKGQKHGGKGGSCSTITLQGTEYFNNVYGCKTASTVQQLEIRTNTNRVLKAGPDCNTFGSVLLYGNFIGTYPSKWVIQGFSGRSGDYLDAIGIVVGDNPDTSSANTGSFLLGHSGGNGGNAFFLYPPENSKISKITVCSGTKIDSIRINDGAKAGGNGGGCNSLLLSANEYISEITGYSDSRGTNGVSSMKIYTTLGRALYAGISPAKDNYSFKGDADNKKITGIVGRSGDRIDAIGIQYGPFRFY